MHVLLSPRAETPLDAVGVVLASGPLNGCLILLHHGLGPTLGGAASISGATQTIHANVTVSLVAVLGETSSIWQHRGVPEVCYGKRRAARGAARDSLPCDPMCT